MAMVGKDDLPPWQGIAAPLYDSLQLSEKPMVCYAEGVITYRDGYAERTRQGNR